MIVTKRIEKRAAANTETENVHKHGKNRLFCVEEEDIAKPVAKESCRLLLLYHLNSVNVEARRGTVSMVKNVPTHSIEFNCVRNVNTNSLDIYVHSFPRAQLNQSIECTRTMAKRV